MPNGYTTKRGNGLTAVAGNAAEALRTIIQDVQDAESFTCCLQLTYDAATAFVVTPWVSCDQGTTYSREDSIAVSGGVGTLSSYYTTKATEGADCTIAYGRECKSISSIKLVVSATGGGASDVINAQSAIGVPK